MMRSVRALLVRVLVITVLVLAAVLALSQVGLVLDPAVPVAGGIVLAAVLWAIRADVDRDDALSVPERHPDPREASPHGGDLQVRRHEELIGAALSGSRERRADLARILADALTARIADPDAPHPDPRLVELVESAADEDRPGSRAALAALGDRTTLHDVLRELVRTSSAEPLAAPTSAAASPPPLRAASPSTPTPQETR